MTPEDLHLIASKICYKHYYRWMDELDTMLKMCNKHHHVAMCASKRSEEARIAYLASKEVMDAIAIASSIPVYS